MPKSATPRKFPPETLKRMWPYKQSHRLNYCRVPFSNSSHLNWCRGVRKPSHERSYAPLPLQVGHTRISPRHDRGVSNGHKPREKEVSKPRKFLTFIYSLYDRNILASDSKAFLTTKPQRTQRTTKFHPK